MFSGVPILPNWNVSLFERQIEEQGQYLLHRKVLSCPCVRNTGSNLGDCKNCNGTGWYYAAPVSIKVLVYDDARNLQFEDSGRSVPGHMKIVCKREVGLSALDRLIAVRSESVENEVVVLNELGGFTHYDISCLEHVSIFVDKDSSHIPISLDKVYFKGRRIQLSSDYEKVANNNRVSVKYRHNPEWRVESFLRESYNVPVGGEKDAFLPVHAFCVRYRMPESEYKDDVQKLLSDELSFEGRRDSVSRDSIDGTGETGVVDDVDDTGSPDEREGLSFRIFKQLSEVPRADKNICQIGLISSQGQIGFMLGEIEEGNDVSIAIHTRYSVGREVDEGLFPNADSRDLRYTTIIGDDGTPYYRQDIDKDIVALSIKDEEGREMVVRTGIVDEGEEHTFSSGRIGTSGDLVTDGDGSEYGEGNNVHGSLDGVVVLWGKIVQLDRGFSVSNDDRLEVSRTGIDRNDFFDYVVIRGDREVDVSFDDTFYIGDIIRVKRKPGFYGDIEVTTSNRLTLEVRDNMATDSKDLHALSSGDADLSIVFTPSDALVDTTARFDVSVSVEDPEKTPQRLTLGVTKDGNAVALDAINAEIGETLVFTITSDAGLTNYNLTSNPPVGTALTDFVTVAEGTTTTNGVFTITLDAVESDDDDNILVLPLTFTQPGTDIGDTPSNIASRSIMATLTIMKKSQTLTSTTVSTGTARMPLTLMVTTDATPPEDFPITFTLTQGEGTISGNTFTPAKAGAIIITANQAGNADTRSETLPINIMVVARSTTLSVTPSDLGDDALETGTTTRVSVSTNFTDAEGDFTFGSSDESVAEFRDVS